MLKWRKLAVLAMMYFVGVAAFAQQSAGYVPWGVDEYELFGLTKQELVAKFKGKLQFSEDGTRAMFGAVEACHTYDGPTFKLSFDPENKRVSSVQRIFVGCTSTQFGPIFDRKQDALGFAISGLSQLAKRGTLKPAELTKLNAAQKMLAQLKANSGKL